MRARLLDLFCGAGGAAMGYHRAGFDVVGVDVAAQPRYPFAFHQADALTFPLEGFDAIHASPPCQVYSTTRTRTTRAHPDLYAATRDRLVGAGVPWVIENVTQAPARSGVVLCGSMFGLRVRRHRVFESSVFMWQPGCRHSDDPDAWTVTVTGNGTWPYDRDRGHRVTVELARAVMGTPWMTRAECSQAVPPAYAEWVGVRLLAALEWSGPGAK